MDGVATYLAYRYGNLRTNENWLPLEEPDAPALAGYILDELQRHPQHWQLRRAAAKALEACANVVQNLKDAERLVFLAIGFEQLDEDDPIKGDNVDNLLRYVNIDPSMIRRAYQKLVDHPSLSAETRKELLEELEAGLQGYAYLEDE